MIQQAMKATTITLVGTMFAAIATGAEMSTACGDWRVSFNETGECLRLANGRCKVSMEGRLSFASEGKPWHVATPRDAASGRLSLVEPKGTVL